MTSDNVMDITEYLTLEEWESQNGPLPESMHRMIVEWDGVQYVSPQTPTGVIGVRK